MIQINRRNIGVCILLSIITFGIYGIYWLYLLVKNTRSIQKNTTSCTGEMLCLIFVPFYSLYWWYTRGEKVKQEFSQHNYASTGNGIVYLILAIFGLSIVSMAIMQSDFNSLKSETYSEQRSTSEIQLNDLPLPLPKKTVTALVWLGIIAFAMKFIVDIVMYLFMLNEQDELYFDFWYLYIPQIISSGMLIAFYSMFFSKAFYGWFFKLSSVALIISSVLFIAFLEFDRRMGYIFYFALVATVNFLNSLYLKCNIIPARKVGAIEYIPLFFEVTELFCMVVSLYSLFCAFPTLKVVASYVYWDYFNIENALMLNIVCEGILGFLFLLCARNGCEYVYDNMYVAFEELEDLND